MACAQACSTVGRHPHLLIPPPAGGPFGCLQVLANREHNYTIRMCVFTGVNAGGGRGAFAGSRGESTSSFVRNQQTGFRTGRTCCPRTRPGPSCGAPSSQPWRPSSWFGPPRAMFPAADLIQGRWSNSCHVPHMVPASPGPEERSFSHPHLGAAPGPFVAAPLLALLPEPHFGAWASSRAGLGRVCLFHAELGSCRGAGVEGAPWEQVTGVTLPRESSALALCACAPSASGPAPPPLGACGGVVTPSPHGGPVALTVLRHTRLPQSLQRRVWVIPPPAWRSPRPGVWFVHRTCSYDAEVQEKRWGGGPSASLPPARRNDGVSLVQKHIFSWDRKVFEMYGSLAVF